MTRFVIIKTETGDYLRYCINVQQIAWMDSYKRHIHMSDGNVFAVEKKDFEKIWNIALNICEVEE